MEKFVILLALWSLSHAAYISRMSPVSRFRGPSAFRPGVVLQRSPFPPRLMSGPSHRTPFVVYRNIPHRYAMKPMNPVATRNFFGVPWKTTARIPVPVTPEYDFARAASSQPVIRTDGAIHTIPAPNLSLSEKPIVVADVGIPDTAESHSAAELVKPTYEVTENNGESQSLKVQSKIEAPAGFSKPSSESNHEYNIHNDANQQLSPEYVQVHQSSIVPQEFSIQTFNGLPSHQDLIQSGAEGLIIPPNAFYQSDPLFLQKLQNQLLQRYPAVEFIPYTPDVQTQIPSQTQQYQPTPFYYENEHIIKQQPMSFVMSENNRNIVQRQTQEGTVQSLVPQTLTANNITEVTTTITSPEVTTTCSSESTISNTVVTENQTAATTVKTEENNSEENRTKPMFYAEIGQNVNNIIPNGFHSAINSMKVSSAIEQTLVDEKSDMKLENDTIPSTTQTVETKHYLDNKVKPESNEILKEYTNFIGSPFEKPAESVNIAYTILRAIDKEPKVVQNGSVLAGQLVEASVSEDKEFHNERALSNRQPQQHSVTEKRSADSVPQKVVKAKIPPKSKLTFDDKTGEPILRVYASYVDSPARKEAITTKLTNLKHLREAISKRQERVENINAATVNDLATDINQFGLRIKSKNTDNVHILDEYDK